MIQSYFIKTWGCQMNEHDTEKIAGMLAAMGYIACKDLNEADIVLLNTCSVREKSYKKAFAFLGTLRKIKEKKPGLIIGICGCIAQQDGDKIFKEDPFVDFLIGPRSLAALPKLIEHAEHDHQTFDLDMRDDFTLLHFSRFIRGTFPKAYITIMEGCNRGCSYCIVPQTRGREVCRPFEDIISEAKFLSSSGYLDVELLGQNVNSYRYGSMNFCDLLLTLSKIDSLKRIRFTTSHPSHLSWNLMQLMKNNVKICNHIHLPVQSGSDKILKLMRRGYKIDDYIEKVLWLKQNIKYFTLSTDIIVGFPYEDDDDFQKTMSLMDLIRYDTIYSFAYSPRPKTYASTMRDDVPVKTKMSRLYALQTRQRSIQEALNEEWRGRTVEVLVEGESKKDKKMLTGRTTNNKIVNFNGSHDLIGRISKVKIKDASVHSLIGITC